MIFFSDTSHINRKAMKFGHKLITTISITQINRGHTIIHHIIVSIHQENTINVSIKTLEHDYSQNSEKFMISI